MARLVRQLPVEGRVDGQWRRRHQQGVAIRRRARDLARAKVATGTRLVVDDDRLPQLLRQPGGDQTAMLSIRPPGGKETINLIGRLGQFCALAAGANRFKPGRAAQARTT